MHDVEDHLIRLSTLLSTSSSDDVDALQAAIDEQFVEAFKHIDGGPSWHFQQPDNSNAKPDPNTDLKSLRTLNEVQALLSSLGRLMDDNSWRVCAKWWLYG